jgi:regulator of protease activity HflC (stomatin/prohibitin superfamily)
MRRAAGGPVIVLSIMMGFGSIGCAAIDAGHEGVLVEQPFFFGHGGVDPVPSKTGRLWLAPTTHVIDVDVRPVQYSEHFDIISAENAPVSFDAFMIANVVEGRSPELIARYGPNWYHNNVKEAFRTFVREEVQKYPLFQLTTDPTTRTKLQEAIAREVQTKLIEKQNIPVRLNRVVVGSILPPKGVVEQTTQTIVQEQRKITMVEFQKAEEAREKAEKQRGIADRAYRESLGLTAPEFVDLRRIEVQKEIVQHSPSALTVIMGLERFGINLPPIGADKAEMEPRPRLHLAQLRLLGLRNRGHLAVGIDLCFDHVTHLNLPAHFGGQGDGHFAVLTVSNHVMFASAHFR